VFFGRDDRIAGIDVVRGQLLKASETVRAAAARGVDDGARRQRNTDAVFSLGLARADIELPPVAQLERGISVEVDLRREAQVLPEVRPTW